MKASDVVLVGLSGNTLEIFEAVQEQHHITAVLSDDPAHGSTFEGVIIFPLSAAFTFERAKFLFLIGSEVSFRARQEMLERLNIPLTRYITLVHPRAMVSRFAKIGAGTVLYAGVTLTANAVLGSHVMVLPHTIIHHDVHIADRTIIGSNVTIAGGVDIGAGCYVGSGASIRNGVQIGEGALIGMAANVVRDVAAGEVVVGNPARVVRGSPTRPE